MNKTIKIQPVILCGGSGTRLWPLSRASLPKQFLKLIGDKSLFQQVLLRLRSQAFNKHELLDAIIVTGEDHRFLAAEQCRDIGAMSVLSILEPEPRNTAPALTMAAFQAVSNGDDPMLVVTPADFTVSDEEAFSESILSAINAAADGSIVTLGVKPTHPHTGYGYICAQTASSKNHFDVKQFTEKPDVVKAQNFLDDGGFYWNAGIFVLTASVWLKTLSKLRPDMYHATKIAWEENIEEVLAGNSFLRPSDKFFVVIPNESIDYAVMENCLGADIPIRMIELNAGWSDLGSWDAVSDALPNQKTGNVFVGDVLSTGTTNTFVHAATRAVAVVGLSNMVVIETSDAVLVSAKSNSQDVKEIINDLEAASRSDHIAHRKVYRPWGWFDVIDEGSCFKVKRIQINPGASLSLQKHAYRSEHWTIVQGVAEVTIGSDKTMLEKNQSTYIAVGVIHRLANTTAEPLELIEVQCGEYLGEDDIERFEDVYGRIES